MDRLFDSWRRDVSHNFIPVQWNRQKKFYDLILILAIVVYIGMFMLSGLKAQAADGVILLMRALGTCALVLLHIILAIGPLARLSDRFKPLLYNRRHFGVITALIGLAHATLVLIWYHGSGVLNPVASALGGYGNYGVAIEFPFETLGLAALIILLIMAATSHDFWLSWLSPPMWKALHMSVYPAYVLLVTHVTLGTAQFDKGNGLLAGLVVGAVTLVILHTASIFKGRKLDVNASKNGGWICVGDPMDIPLNRAVTVSPGKGERIAIFRHSKGLSAIMAVCSHQNGPLGEGCILDGLVTCPWHGFQFDPETGAAPPPFEDRVETHEIKMKDGKIWVNAEPDPRDTIRPALGIGK